MDWYSFTLGVILGVGLPLAVVEVRDFLRRRSEANDQPSSGWADEAPRLQCPLPSPHLKHDERVCAISWYLKHQDASLPVLPYEKMKALTLPTLNAREAHEWGEEIKRWTTP